MFDSSIIQLLKTLTKRELVNLYSFIRSDIYSKSKENKTHRTAGKDKIIELYKILRKEYPDFKGKALRKENVFGVLFHGEKYNDAKLRNLRHELAEVTENYLTYLDNLQNPVHNKIHLINQMEKRGSKRMLELNINEAFKLTYNIEITDENYYFQKYLLINKKWNELDKKTYLGKTESNFVLFRDEMDCSVNGFLIVMLRELSLIQHYKTHVELNLETGFYELIFNYLVKNKKDFRLNPYNCVHV